MKILHTSDWHLGKNIYGYSLYEEQKKFVTEKLGILIEEEKPDVIVISGDIYDKKLVSTEAIELFDNFLSTAIEKYQIPIFVITGNHDSAERFAIATNAMKKNKLYIANKISQCLTPTTIKDEYGEVDFYMLPYCKKEEIAQFLKIEIEECRKLSENEIYTRLFNLINEKKRANVRSVFLAHLFIGGSTLSNSEDIISVGTIEQINSSIFPNFTYVALGHIHKNQNIAKNAHYCGAPLQYAIDEKNNKSVSFVQLSDNNFTITEKNITQDRPIRTISGKFDDIILNARNDTQCNDFVYFKLTDEDFIVQPLVKLKSYYPYALGIEYAKVKNINNVSTNSELEKLLANKELDNLELFKLYLSYSFDEDKDEVVKNHKPYIDLFKNVCLSKETEV